MLNCCNSTGRHFVENPIAIGCHLPFAASRFKLFLLKCHSRPPSEPAPWLPFLVPSARTTVLATVAILPLTHHVSSSPETIGRLPGEGWVGRQSTGVDVAPLCSRACSSIRARTPVARPDAGE